MEDDDARLRMAQEPGERESKSALLVAHKRGQQCGKLLLRCAVLEAEGGEVAKVKAARVWH